VYAIPQHISAQNAAPNKAPHVFAILLNDFMSATPTDSLDSAASAHVVASIPRALYSGIARASLNATDSHALLCLD
tara:strand:+ start:241 stop:468 length:228 start_codon:yes stop_codon:yes gene_type:complete